MTSLLSDIAKLICLHVMLAAWIVFLVGVAG